MLNDKTVRGTNFTCVHVGPKEAWTQYHLEPPDVPIEIDELPVYSTERRVLG